MVSHTASSSRREAPEVLLLASAQRGRGECRMPNAPAASCALVVVERTRVTTSTPESPGIPARNGFNGFLRALPGGSRSQSGSGPTPAILRHTIDRNDFAEHQKDCGISQHSHFLTKRACHDEIA